MTGMSTRAGLPFGRPLTVEDLQTMPDDGHRYELLDGTLLVSPGPSWAHQEVAGRLYLCLMDACPEDLRVIIAPFAVRLGPHTELQPDVLIARFSDLTPADLPVAPLLAVEVRSPSTALVDLNLKRAAYGRAGVISYWIIDPLEPSITILELTRDGCYVETAHARGEETVSVQQPFPVTLVPSDLRRGLDPN